MKDLLWLINATWAHKGRVGETESVVEAPDAIEALREFWKTEDAKGLRDVTIKWLGPLRCVVNHIGESRSHD